MLLGLDLGTTNIKASVARYSGRIIGSASAPVNLLPVGEDGVEQDIEEIWRATLEAIRRAVRNLDAGEVRAIGVSSQGGALQLLDGEGKPLERVVSWLDSRGRSEDARLTRLLGSPWLIRHTGHARSGFAVGQLRRLWRENRKLLAPPRRVGFVGDVIVQRLCGRAAQDGTSAALTLLYDPQRRDYAVPLLRRVHVRKEQLPDLLTPRESAGSLLAAVARETGLPSGIPVAPAVHDQYATALGARVVEPGDVMFGAGTAWVLLALSATQLRPVIEEALVCHHLVDGCHGQILSLHNGGSAIRWAKELLGVRELPDAAIDDLLASAPAGAGGIQCVPFFAPHAPARLAAVTRARYSALQLGHSRAHFLRATLEGLTYELNRHLDFLRAAKMSPQRIVMCGGAARSRITPQIVADVTGLPVCVSAGGEEGSLGALVLARGLIETQRPLRSLAEEMGPAFQTISPGPDAVAYVEGYKAYLHSLR